MDRLRITDGGFSSCGSSWQVLKDRHCLWPSMCWCRWWSKFPCSLAANVSHQQLQISNWFYGNLTTVRRFVFPTYFCIFWQLWAALSLHLGWSEMRIGKSKWCMFICGFGSLTCLQAWFRWCIFDAAKNIFLIVPDWVTWSGEPTRHQRPFKGRL